MRSDHLLNMAMARYASALRAGTATPYECLRFFETYHSYHEDDGPELMRLALVTLVRHDPLLLITSPQGGTVDGLSEADVDAAIEEWDVEDEHLAALLEGHLRMAAASRKESSRGQVANALSALERAEPGFRGDRDFLELYTVALRRLGDARFSSAVDELLEQTSPEWRAHPLKDAMREAVQRSDWNRYDVLRRRWAALPQNALMCECSINYVANIDGIRALHRGDEQEALRYLRAAVSVKGCPHLNSGGATLLLAQELLDRGIKGPDVVEHLAVVEQYRKTEATSRLRARLARQHG